MVQHHLVSFAPYSGELVAAEGGMGWIQVIAVGPDAARMQPAPPPIGRMDASRPYGRPQPVQRVIANVDRFLLVFEGRNGDHGAKDFLLENAHLVVPLEDRRLHVVTAGDV